MEPDSEPSSNDKVSSFFLKDNKSAEDLHFEKSKKTTHLNPYQKQLHDHLN